MNAASIIPDNVALPTALDQSLQAEKSDSEGPDCTEFIIVRTERVLGVLNGPIRSAEKSGEVNSHQEERTS